MYVGNTEKDFRPILKDGYWVTLMLKIGDKKASAVKGRISQLSSLAEFPLKWESRTYPNKVQIIAQGDNFYGSILDVHDDKGVLLDSPRDLRSKLSVGCLVTCECGVSEYIETEHALKCYKDRYDYDLKEHSYRRRCSINTIEAVQHRGTIYPVYQTVWERKKEAIPYSKKYWLQCPATPHYLTRVKKGLDWIHVNDKMYDGQSAREAHKSLFDIADIAMLKEKYGEKFIDSLIHIEAPVELYYEETQNKVYVFNHAEELCSPELAKYEPLF